MINNETINKSNEELFQEKINKASDSINKVIKEVHKKIVGQDELIKSMLI
jgi:hypothetical protein